MGKGGEFWQVPKFYKGTPCYILAGGPSLPKIDIDRLRGAHVIVVNHAHRVAPWADFLYFGDDPFWDSEKDAILEWFKGFRVTRVQKLKSHKGVNVVKHDMGISGIDDGRIKFNKSSGGAAINLAYLLGAGTIILMGYDMRVIEGQKNWRQDPYKDATDSFSEAYREFAKWFPDLVHIDRRYRPKEDPYKIGEFTQPLECIARDFAYMRMTCINATPGSGVKAFPMADPEEVYPDVLEANRANILQRDKDARRNSKLDMRSQ